MQNEKSTYNYNVLKGANWIEDLKAEIIKSLKNKLAPPHDEEAIDIVVAAETIATEAFKQKFIYWSRNIQYGKFVNQNQWQPIETAPKDGSKIIVYRPNHDGTYIPKVGIDFWMKDLNCWGKSRTDTQPTHWQPLPKPPGELDAFM